VEYYTTTMQQLFSALFRKCNCLNQTATRLRNKNRGSESCRRTAVCPVYPSRNRTSNLLLQLPFTQLVCVVGYREIPKNDVIFVFPKTFLCFRVRVSGNTFKNVFGQTSIRTGE